MKMSENDEKSNPKQNCEMIVIRTKRLVGDYLTFDYHILYLLITCCCQLKHVFPVSSIYNFNHFKWTTNEMFKIVAIVFFWRRFQCEHFQLIHFVFWIICLHWILQSKLQISNVKRKLTTEQKTERKKRAILNLVGHFVIPHQA